MDAVITAQATPWTWYAFLSGYAGAAATLVWNFRSITAWFAGGVHGVTGALEEAPKVKSFIRAQLFITTLACVVLPMTVWAGASAWVGHPVEMPASLCTFCGAVFGASLTGKVVQYTKEPDAPKLPPEA